MKAIIVSFNHEGDGTTALYLDGKLETHGDYYHDKIDDYIRGFVDGLKRAGKKVTVENWLVDADDCSDDYYCDCPEKWPDKKYAKVAHQ